jgi:hypothetical protein
MVEPKPERARGADDRILKRQRIVRQGFHSRCNEIGVLLCTRLAGTKLGSQAADGLSCQR